MAYWSYIVHRASEAVGLKDFNSESMEGDDFRKVFIALQDVVRSLNSNQSYLFGITTVSKVVSSDALTFMPYNAAERAIIAGGGTVDITDRIVDVRPTVCPMAYINEARVQVVDALDLPMFADRYTCAWEPDHDRDVLRFGKALGGDTVTLRIRKPIPVPERPNDVAQVPERFIELLVLSLAVSIATKLGMVETLGALKESLLSEIGRVTKNNLYSRPVVLDSCMNRFN